MEKIIIRKYIESDMQQIVALFDEFGGYLAHIDPLKRLRRTPGYGEHVLTETLKEVKKKEGVFYVAMDDEKVIGFIVGTIKRQSPEDQLSVIPSTLGRITELYIDGLYRGKGVGTQLMNKVEEYFKQTGCDIARVEVFVPNEAAHNLYKKMGYDDRDIDMIKNLR